MESQSRTRFHPGLEELHPRQPEFWNTRYESGQTQWGLGGVPGRLQEYLKPHPRGGSVLIPGCGSGHEIAAFAAAGYEVTALDFAPATVAQTHTRLGPPLADRVLLGDFFTYDIPTAPFDVIYERTFFCAIPPAQRAAYVQRMAQLLKPDGELGGLFYFGTEPSVRPTPCSPTTNRSYSTGTSSSSTMNPWPIPRRCSPARNAGRNAGAPAKPRLPHRGR